MYQLPEKEICFLYEKENFSLKELMLKYNLKNYSSIRRVLVKNNIKIRKNTNKRLNKHKLNVDYFKEINSKEKAYFLGWIVSDGCLHKTKYKVSFHLKEREPLDKLKLAINTTIPISPYDLKPDKRTNKIYSGFSFQINSRQFHDNLVKLGVNIGKSQRCKVPKMNKKFISHFFRGLFDGDGSIHIAGPGIRVNLIATHEIINFLIKFLKIKHYNIVTVKDNIVKIYLYSETKRFLDFIYQDCSEQILLSRKYKLYKNLFYSNKKFLLIDVDGTICETKEMHYLALNKALNEVCNLSISLEDHKNIFEGLSTDSKLQILENKKVINKNDFSLIKEKKQLYVEQLFEKIKYSRALIMKFHAFKKMGFEIVLCSNMVRKSLDIIINKLNLQDLIKFSLSNEDVENPKPSPDIWLKAVKILNTTKDKCLIFEDSENGIKSAINSEIDYVKVESINSLTKNLLLLKLKNI